MTRIFDIKFPRPTIENLLGYTSRKKLAHDPFEIFLDPLPGDNFTNILLKGFTLADPKSAEKSDRLTVFFALLVSVRIKAAQKMLVKLTPGVATLYGWQATLETKYSMLASLCTIWTYLIYL